MSDLDQHSDNNIDQEDGEAFVFPASFGQRRLWFLDQLEPGSSAYNISMATRIGGALDTNALQAALNDLIARHETLRTCFDVEDDEPVQVVEETGSITLQIHDGSSLSDEAAEHLLKQLASQGFDLSSGPLLSAHLIQSSADNSILLLNIHHIIADAWSLGILYSELVALYEQHSGGDTATLSELDIQYGDFAEWQQEWLEGDDYKAQLGYWKDQLADAPPVLELPTDHPRPRVQTHNGAILSRSLPSTLAAELRKLAQSQSCTLFMVLLAAYDVLLSKYSGSDDIVVGTPIAGRSRRELEPLIGFFANTLAMRADLSGNPAFTELLQKVRGNSLEAYKHQDLPFEKLVEEIQPDRLMSYSPVFQALFVLEHAAAQSSPFSSLTAEAVRVKSDTAKFDISLFISEAPDSLTCTMEYNTDLFDEVSVENMLRRFETLLRQITQQPDVRIGDISLLDSADLELVTCGYNNTATDFGALQPVHQLVEAQAAKTPDAVALEGVDELLSYAELNSRANRLAHALQAAGAAPGKLVAISCERSPELPVAVLAVLKSGAAYVPVDPHYPADRIKYMLDDSGAEILISQSSLSDQLPEHAAHKIFIDQFDFQTGDDSNPQSGVGVDDPLYAIYTSGSTGLPKGVVLNHAGLANLIHWQLGQNRLSEPARTLQYASISFDVSFQELFTTWAQGGTLVMITEELRKDLPALAGFISKRAIERMYMPYAALQPLAEILADRDDLPTSLHDIISAGEQLQVTPAIRRFFSRCGGRLHNQYGPSETHVVTALTLDQPCADWPELPTIGYPVANTRCYILDENGQPVAPGVPGELYLAGIQVAREYVGRPELSAEKILNDPYVSGERMYRSGDSARHLADGEIEYLGRVDEQVKFRGFRIEPGEIESVLSQHPDVQLAAVVLLTEGEKKLVAYATGESSNRPDTASLRDYLKAQLPDYMVPTHFVVLDEMPVTPSGKIARRLLPEPSWERSAGDEYTAPRNPNEESLAAIWSEVLDVDQVGIHDDFFDLGGHSLLATQVISRVRSRLGAEIPLLKLFEAPTVAEFSALLSQPAGEGDSGTGQDDSIPVRSSKEAAPLSFAQQRLWFLEQLDPGNPAYNFPIATRFGNELDRGVLQQAINKLVERHESLRTRFIADGQTPKQEVLPRAEVALQVIDIAAGELQNKLTELSQQPFDLTQAPLLRARLLVHENEQVLFLDTHHIVSDGWSLGVLFNDLADFYNELKSGSVSKLTPLRIQYADYAEWQRDWFDDAELQRQLDFWRGHLAGADPVLELPTDMPRPPEQTYQGSSTVRVFDKAISEGIKALAQEQRSTLFMVLLGAFNALLARYSRQEHIVVGTPIAGRNDSELENLIGFFSNTLALHNDLSGDPAFTDLLAQIKERTLQAYDHQDLPFEKLVEELRPERDMSHTPIFQTMFVLQNTPTGSTAFDGVMAESVNFEMGITKFDLLLEVRDTPNGLQAGFQFNSDIFLQPTIERMLAHFETLLGSIVAKPTSKLSTLQLLDDAETRTVTERFNSTAIDYSAGEVALTPQRAVELQADKTPDAIAIESAGASASETVSYRQLNERANQLARKLAAAGAGPGGFVGICAERSAHGLIGLLAILKTGAAYVPVDPDYPADRISFMISNSNMSAILVDNTTSAVIPASGVTAINLSENYAEGDAGNLNITPDAEDPLYVIYTSGSTGTPKAVVLPQRALANLLAWQTRRPGFEHAARTLQYASLSFDVHHQEIFPTWATGGTLVLIDQELRQDLPALVRFISEQKVQRLWMPFAALQPTAEIMAEREDLDFALEQICTSGEQLQVTPLIRKLFKRYPDIGFHNEYGPSEAHVVSIYSFAPGADRWAALPPIGKPVPNTQLYILDQAMQPCPVGIPGELFIGGTQVTLGYLNQPERTAESLIHNPFSAGKLYRTGDLARFLPDGNIAYLGRADEQIKYRGFRIEPGEIEAALAAEANVNLTAVLLREDKPGDKRLVGYVTADPGTVIEEKALKTELQSKLPEYMVPGHIVVLDAMPVTPSGKISRRELPAPDLERDADAVIAPRNETESQIAELWTEVLGVNNISIDDDFFDLGGHSLLATQLISRIRDEFGIELPLKYVFRNPTIAALGEQISALRLTTGQASDVDDDDDMEEFEI